MKNHKIFEKNVG